MFRKRGFIVEFSEIYPQAIAMLKPKRIPHVEGCISEAERLAERWGANIIKARIAALLHDCTKALSSVEQLKLCEKYGIIPNQAEMLSPELLHQKTGAELARERFGVDSEIADAIRRHTTGGPHMSLLEKIIYIADYIEPTRRFSGVEHIRELAYADLDVAVRESFVATLRYVLEQGRAVCTDMVDGYNYLLIEKRDRENR